MNELDKKNNCLKREILYKKKIIFNLVKIRIKFDLIILIYYKVAFKMLFLFKVTIIFK